MLMFVFIETVLVDGLDEADGTNGFDAVHCCRFKWAKHTTMMMCTQNDMSLRYNAFICLSQFHHNFVFFLLNIFVHAFNRSTERVHA